MVALHLNDSRTTVGSRLDRHEHIGAGKMGEQGMSELLHHPWLATLPTYLETPGMDSGYDKVNLDRARMADRRRGASDASAGGIHAARIAREDGASRAANPVVRKGTVPRAYIEQRTRTGICGCRPHERPFPGDHSHTANGVPRVR